MQVPASENSDVTIQLNWTGPYGGNDVAEIDPKPHIPRNVVGVYLQVRISPAGEVVCSYVGKSKRCLLKRQLGHFNKVAHGGYSIVDEHGVLVFTGGSAKPERYIDDIAAPYWCDLKVYFASVESLKDTDAAAAVDAVEGALISSSRRASVGGINLNRSKPRAHKSFHRLRIIHCGPEGPLKVFGPETLWEKKR